MQTLIDFMHAYLLMGVFFYGIAIAILCFRFPYDNHAVIHTSDVILGIAIWPILLGYSIFYGRR